MPLTTHSPILVYTVGSHNCISIPMFLFSFFFYYHYIQKANSSHFKLVPFEIYTIQPSPKSFTRHWMSEYPTTAHSRRPKLQLSLRLKKKKKKKTCSMGLGDTYLMLHLILNDFHSDNNKINYFCTHISSIQHFVCIKYGSSLSIHRVQFSLIICRLALLNLKRSLHTEKFHSTILLYLAKQGRYLHTLILTNADLFQRHHRV